MRGNTDANLEAEVLVSQVGGGAIKLAFSTEPGQRWPRQGSIRGQAAAEMTATREVRFWTADPGVYEAAALCVEQGAATATARNSLG